MNTTNFTKQQLDDWKDFERVRKSGRWNMYDPRARQTAGLTREEYSFVMKNFAELKTAVEQSVKTPATS